MFIKRLPLLYFTIIPLVSLLLHWKVFDQDLIGLHCMRQAQTQQNIQNFYRYDANILNPRINVLSHDSDRPIYRYEFPVMQWTVGMVYHLTGESFLVTRIAMFLLGIFTLGGLFFLFRQLFDDTLTAWAGAWAFSFSPVFYFYSMNPMPDNLGLCGVTWSMAFFFRFLKRKDFGSAFFSAFFLSLGAAGKLPYIIFIAAPGLYALSAVFSKLPLRIPDKKDLRFIAAYFGWLLPTFAWYAWVVPGWSNGVVQGIFDHPLSVAELLDTLKFHYEEMFPERLLGYSAVPFFLSGVFFFVKNKVWRNTLFKYLFVTMLAVIAYWIFEFNMIGKTHDYYMMPFLPLLFILAAYGCRNLWQWGHFGKAFTLIFLVVIPYVTFNQTKNYWSVEASHFVQDVFRYKEDLKKAAPAGARCIILNDPTHYVFSYLIDKPGFVFWDDHLPALWVEDLIKNYEVTHFYSDSRKVDENPEVSQYFETLVMERGAVKVFKMKNLQSVHNNQ
jgi:hypothetical protein